MWLCDVRVCAPVRALVWRRRACEAYGVGVFCGVARAGCSVLLRCGCGGASGEVGLVCVLCVHALGLWWCLCWWWQCCGVVVVRRCAGGWLVAVAVVLSAGCALCCGFMRA